MYCSSCGTQLPENAQFCYSCGNKTAVPHGGATSTAQAPAPQTSTSSVTQVLQNLVELLVSAANGEQYGPWQAELRAAAAEVEGVVSRYGRETIIPDMLNPTARRMMKNVMMTYARDRSNVDENAGKVIAELEKVTQTSVDLAEVLYKMDARRSSQPRRQYSDATWRQLDGQARSTYCQDAAEYYGRSLAADSAENREFYRRCVSKIEDFLQTGRDRDHVVSELERELRSLGTTEAQFAHMAKRVYTLLSDNMITALGAGVLLVEPSEDASEYVVDNYKHVLSPSAMRDFLYELCTKWENFALSAPVAAACLRAFEVRN